MFFVSESVPGCSLRVGSASLTTGLRGSSDNIDLELEELPLAVSRIDFIDVRLVAFRQL
jgi:hypothetical protein